MVRWGCEGVGLWHLETWFHVSFETVPRRERINKVSCIPRDYHAHKPWSTQIQLTGKGSPTPLDWAVSRVSRSSAEMKCLWRRGAQRSFKALVLGVLSNSVPMDDDQEVSIRLDGLGEHRPYNATSISTHSNSPEKLVGGLITIKLPQSRWEGGWEQTSFWILVEEVTWSYRLRFLLICMSVQCAEKWPWTRMGVIEGQAGGW